MDQGKLGAGNTGWCSERGAPKISWFVHPHPCHFKLSSRMGPARSLPPGLFPFPHFGNGGAGGVYLVFEGDASIIEAGKLLRSGPEEEHSAVADRASRAEFTHTRSLPRSCF